MNSKKLFVSIVVPTYKRQKSLYNCLNSLASQTYPDESFEVIVVNDGILEESEVCKPDVFGIPNLYVYSKKHAGPASARNFGVEMAKGELIIFTDDDCSPKSDWIERMVYGYESGNNPVIGGKTLNLLTNNFYSEASQIINDIVYNHFNKDPDNALFLASNNLAISKDLFLKLDGFDISYTTSSSEDRDLCNRLISSGHVIKFISDAIVYHAHELTMKSFFLQHFSYGRGAYLFQKKQKQRGTGSMLKDMSFHSNYKNYIINPLIKVPYVKILPLLFLLLIWQFANTVGFFSEFFLNTIQSLYRTNKK